MRLSYFATILFCAQARFRSEHADTLCYTVANWRFCHKIGRQHKSNGVFFVADLLLQALYQKCHDPDCRGFRSNGIPLIAVATSGPPSTSQLAEAVTHPVRRCDNAKLPQEEEEIDYSFEAELMKMDLPESF